jgi:hypothetical protein
METIGLFGDSVGKVVVRLLVYIVGIYFASLVFPIDRILQRELPTVGLFLISGSVIFVLVFLLNLIRAPYILDVQRLAEMESVSGINHGLVARNTRLITESEEDQKKILDWKTQREAVQEELSRVRQENSTLSADLRSLQEKNAVARLTGKIICLDVTPQLNTKSESAYDVFLIALLRVVNESPTPTMISRWQLDLIWKGVEHPSVRGRLDGYRRKRDFKHPKPGAWETEVETQWLPLDGFPDNEEINNTNYKAGTVRFSVGSFPIDAIKSERLDQDVVLRIQVIDSKDNPHLIYEGTTWGLSSCGTIRRAKQSGQFTRAADGHRIGFEFIDYWEE